MISNPRRDAVALPAVIPALGKASVQATSLRHPSVCHFIEDGRRWLVGLAAGCLLLPLTVLAQQATPPPASVRLNELGPENQALAQRVGLWDVTETVWAAPGATPVSTTGLVAERRMMGSLLQEFLRLPHDQSDKAVQRMDLLSFNRIEGLWEYVSFDTRAPVGLMPAWSNVQGDGTTIALTFAPFAVPGPGAEVTGQLLRMKQIIRYEGPDRDVKEQYFTLADGTGTKWLAHRYVYARRR